MKSTSNSKARDVHGPGEGARWDHVGMDGRPSPGGYGV